MAAHPTTLRPIDFDQPLTLRLSRDLDGVFTEVVSSHEEAVFTTALRVSGHPGEAEDLAAETFLRAYSALRRYPPDRVVELQLRPWLITICLNLWRNQLRAASRRPRADTGVVAPEPPAPNESPQDRAERHDQADRLAAWLQRLPAQQRIAVVLRHIVGLSYAELAHVLGCPESTAKSHVRRGLDQLRTLLTHDPEVLP
ncbi:MAG: RNA polymerase sigma factor [Actinomycetota bacterium]|nr:RNA polymerase sigma factor [Actinomycetota bacterium]